MKRKTRANKALISYIRVSTAEQGLSGLGLDAQREAIRRYAEATNQVIRAEFTEVISSGKSRPVFDEALAMAEQYDDILTVAKLDRLARDLHTITSLQKSKVEFLAVDMPGASKFIIQIMGAVAENERDTTQERTRAALARAKANGTRLGAPDPVANVSSAIVRRSTAAEEFRSQIREELREMRANGSTLQQIADHLNRNNIPTASGTGIWCPMKVSNALKKPIGLNLAPASHADAGQAADATQEDKSPARVGEGTERSNVEDLPLWNS